MNAEIVLNPADMATPCPKSGLLSLVGILQAVAGASEWRVTVSELADALGTAGYAADSMALYDGSGSGLAFPIVWNGHDENSGYNQRNAVILDLFNVRFWDNVDATICRVSVGDYMVSKEDGADIARRLWKYCFPGDDLRIDVDDIAMRREEASNRHDASTARPQEIARPYPGIHGATFARLQAALEAYPVAYAGKTPKLDGDVRPWLKKRHGCTVREAEVFGAIIAEHFGPK